MAKTKFLSKVLAVLMVLSMLCSTGVFADYGTGALVGTTEGPITITKMLLDGTQGLNDATTEAAAMWADVVGGIQLEMEGSVADATTGVVMYHVVETGKLDEIPLNLDAVEAATIAIGKLDVDANGAFAGKITIAENQENLVVGATYELRYSYSTTESTDTTDTYVYQRYIKTKATPKLTAATYTTTAHDRHTEASVVSEAKTVVPQANGDAAFTVFVPVGTGTVTATVAVGDAVSESISLDLEGSDAKAVEVAVGDYTYNVTFKWENTNPYISDVVLNGAYNGRWGVDYGVDGDLTHLTDGTNQSGALSTTTLASIFKEGENAPTANKYVYSIASHMMEGKNNMPNNVFGMRDTAYEGTTPENSLLSFKVSASGTVYTRAVTADKTWEQLEAAGWTQEGTIGGYKAYKLDVQAGDVVCIPGTPIDDAEAAAAGTSKKKYIKYIADEKVNTADGEKTQKEAFGTNSAKEGQYYAWNVSSGTLQAPVVSSSKLQTLSRAQAVFYVVFDEVVSDEPSVGALESISYTTAVGFSGENDGSQKFANAVVNAEGEKKPIYTGGFYKPVVISEATDVSVDMEAKTFAITVPYGTEIVNLSVKSEGADAVVLDPIYMLNDNGAAKTVTVTDVAGNVFTGTITWAAVTDANIGLVGTTDVYDVKYRTNDLYTPGQDGYHIVPTKLNLDGVHYVIDEEYYKTNELTAPTSIGEEVQITNASYLAGNVTAKTQKSSAAFVDIKRWKIASQVFDTWVAARLIANVQDLHNATLVNTAMHYKASDITANAGVNAAMAELLKFKVRENGVVYVIPGTYTGFNEEGWSKVDVDTYIARVDGSKTYTTSYDDAVYVKSVKAGDEIAISMERDGQQPPLVIYDAGATYETPPTVEYVKYSTKATLYKVAEVTDTEIEELEDQTISVPWSTGSVSLTYKLIGEEEPVELSADLIENNGEASIEVELPDKTFTVTFAWDTTRPEGQYVTNLKKYDTYAKYNQRIYAAYGDLDDVYVAADSGYAPITTSELFFGEDRTNGIAQRGKTVVIADAYYNVGRAAYASNITTYPYTDYPANTIDDAYMSFTLAKAGYVYVVPAAFDANGEWAEGKAQGWTKAPFTFSFDEKDRVVYQKHYNAGATVLIPGNKITQAELDAVNANSEEYEFVYVDDADIAAIKAAKSDITQLVNGDLVAKYKEAYLAENPDTTNYAGFVPSGTSILHYTRSKSDMVITFAVADDCVDAKFKVQTYKGADLVKAGETFDFTVESMLYGENSEIVCDIVEGADLVTAFDYNEETGAWTITVNKGIIDSGKQIKIKIAQNGVEIFKTIGITELTYTEYGYLTVNDPEGFGAGEIVLNKGAENEQILAEDIKLEKRLLEAGALVTLSAVPEVANYKFQYWARLNNDGTSSVYNRHAEFVLAVPNDITLYAVYKKAEEGTYTVSFLGYQDAMIASYPVNAETGNISIPDMTNYKVFGYEFKYFETAALPNEKFGAGYTESIPAELVDTDMVFKAVYEQKAEMTYTVAVAEGTGTIVVDGVAGTEPVDVLYNTRVTVKANEDVEGSYFKHWEDENGQVLSYERNYTFYAMAADRTVKAIYAETEPGENVAPVLTMTVTEVESTTENPMFALFAERRVPEGYTIIANGIVWGTAADLEDAENITLEKGTGYRRGAKESKYQNNNGQVVVRLEKTPERLAKGSKWYARTYITINNGGKIDTLFSKPVLVWNEELSE